jgi:hypothetical protein
MTGPSYMRKGSFTQNDLKDLACRCIGPERVPDRFRIITDTSDFFRVEFNDVLLLDGLPFLIRNYEREGRFGIEDQPKFWVKRAIDLYSGEMKIIKMVFPEKFTARIGDMVFDCVRSPKKEARILDLVKGHPGFMQGFATEDSAGNIVRVIDYIHGRVLAYDIPEQGSDHEDYFFNYFPAVLNDFIALVEAIGFLHDHGEKHGDIRRDHIIKESRQGLCRWIDFDFNYWHRENMFGYDLFGLGNVLVYLAGRGDITSHDLKAGNAQVFDELVIDDMNIVFNNRLVNLQKVYPYVPDVLNTVLLHFSTGAGTFYDNTGQLLGDLYEVKENLES